MGLFSMPFRGLLRVFEEVAERAETELWGEDAARTELAGLYGKLEAGAISEQEFGQRETEIVGRLAAIAARAQRGARRGVR